jgi:hypothetical protein
MPTKMTEYIASKTPILLYAPSNIAVTEYLDRNNAAHVVSNSKNLKKELENFIKFSSKKNISINAYNLAVNNHNLPTIQNKFVSLLNSIK